LLASLSAVCPGEETAGRKLLVTASANLLRSPNAGYRQVYGQSTFMPEIKITSLLYHGISLWAGCGWISDNGFIEEINEKAKIRKTLFSVGLGYVHKLNASLQLRGELGLVNISYKEEAMAVTMKGSGLGLKIGAILDYFIGKKVFLLLAAAYSQASDDAQTGKIELGGVQLGAGFGFAF
jgi:hypothetical protein